MFEPTAHRLTRPPRLLLLLILVVSLMALVTVGALVWVPWRQTVIGQGEVSVFDPLDRPQNVESQIKGRLVELLVQEGELVEEGQVLARLEDRESKFLNPEQRARLEAQISALEQKGQAARLGIQALESQLEAVERSRQASLGAVEGKLKLLSQKREVQQQQLRLGRQEVVTAGLQRDRIRLLNEKGLKSDRDLELTLQKLVEAETKLQKMEGDLTLVERDADLAALERPKIEAEAMEKSQKIRESISKSLQVLAEVDEKLQKLSNEVGTLEARRSLSTIVAPRPGRIVNLRKLGPGQLLKEGDVLAYIAPREQSRGVELYLSGLDAPLVEVGRPVRLMFEGFPAVPFVGWPWASVGTFGGRVAYVDPVVTDKKGFRVWILPDSQEPDWPSPDYLRLGSRVTGWIMLNEVPLYWEVWRQLNAFPAQPVVSAKAPKTKPVIRR